jgi:hypothetical protein
MTSSLLEEAADTHSIDTGSPRYLTKAVITFGHQLPTHGVVGGTFGQAGCGFQAGTDYFAAGAGMARQAPFFEASGSAVDNAECYVNYESILSILINGFYVQNFKCGRIDIRAVTPIATGSLEGIINLGGKTLKAKAGAFKTSGVTGPHSEVGIGFQPQLLLMASAGQGFFGDLGVGGIQRGTLTYGAFDGVNQWGVCYQSGSYLTGGTRISRFSASEMAPFHYLGGRISGTSLDSDGFTVNYTSSNGFYLIYIALADVDGEFAVGTGVAGDTSIATGFAVDPEVMMFANAGVASLDTTENGASLGFGGCDAALTQAAGWGAGSNANNGDNRSYWQNSAIAAALHPASALPSTAAEASVTAWGTSPTLNWTTGGGSGIRFGWVAMRTSEGVGFGGCGTEPWVYRYRSP